MKLKTNLLLLASAGVLLFAQCKKDKTEDPTPTPTTPAASGPTTITEVFAQNGVQAQSGTALTISSQTVTLSGVGIEIPASAFLVESTGLPPTPGTVNLSIKGILTKKDIILTGAPANSAGKLIATKGCVKVSASQNSQTLRVNPAANVYVNIPESGTLLTNLKKYYALQISVTDTSKKWRPAADQNFISTVQDTSGNKYYHVKLDSAAWLNAGYEWDTIGPVKTGVYAQLDSSFTSSNTVVYLSFNGKLIVGAMYSQGNGSFYIDNIPVGTPVYFVVISIKNGTYYKAFVSATIGTSHLEQITPTSTTLSVIQSQLALLP